MVMMVVIALMAMVMMVMLTPHDRKFKVLFVAGRLQLLIANVLEFPRASR